MPKEKKEKERKVGEIINGVYISNGVFRAGESGNPGTDALNDEWLHIQGRKDRGEPYEDICPRCDSEDFTRVLKDASIQISMDGKGRWVDNVFIERLWRSLKYEEIYLHAYDSIPQARDGIRRWMHFYNHRRKHQALEKRAPDTLYYEHLNAEARASA